jgi:hypothetical protein
LALQLPAAERVGGYLSSACQADPDY